MDVILPAPVNAASTGATTGLVNGATVTNKGVELSGNIHPYQTKDVDFSIGGNYAKNQGNVASLIEGVQFIPYNNEGFTGAIGSSTVGFAPGVLRGQDWIRCGLGESATLPGGAGPVPIDPLCGNAPKNALFIASNAQPIVNPDEQVIADPNPKWTAGINALLRFRNFQLSTLFDMRRGGQVWDGTRSALDRFGTSEESLVRTSTNGVFGTNGNVLTRETVAGPGAGQTAFKTLQDWQRWFTGLGWKRQLGAVAVRRRRQLREMAGISLIYTLEARSCGTGSASTTR